MWVLCGGEWSCFLLAGAMVSMSEGRKPVMWKRWCSGDLCRFTYVLEVRLAMECNGCEVGSVQMRAAARKRTLWNRRSIGSMCVCTSIVSAAASESAPVMCLAALRWMVVSLVVAYLDPRVFLDPGMVWRPVYQTSAAYVNAGTATVFQSCLSLRGHMPPVFLLMRHNCAVHHDAFEIAFSACSLKDRRGSNMTPRYL